MRNGVTASDAKKRVPDSQGRGNFQKVLDGRGNPIRGLWQRNNSFYARLSVENPCNGVKEIRRVPLKDANTLAVARKELNRLLTRREDNDLPALKRAPKFGEFAATYLAHLRVVVDAKRPSTVKKEEYILRQWCDHMGETRLNHINPVMIRAFIARRQGSGLSGRTVNLDVIVLRNVLRRAIDDGWIKSLPTENLRPLKWTAKRRGLVTTEIINRLCERAMTSTKNGQQFADYVRLMAFSGARRNEALRLAWTDVNWSNRQLAVGTDGLAKNREHRVVDFNPSLEQHLRDMENRQAPDSQFLFPSPQRGTRDLAAKSFIDSLKLTRKAAALNFNFHDCRHFFISMAVMSGIDFMTIARWVGHKDGGVLIGKVYGHLSNEHTRRQAQKLVFQPTQLPMYVA